MYGIEIADFHLSLIFTNFIFQNFANFHFIFFLLHPRMMLMRQHACNWYWLQWRQCRILIQVCHAIYYACMWYLLRCFMGGRAMHPLAFSYANSTGLQRRSAPGRILCQRGCTAHSSRCSVWPLFLCIVGYSIYTLFLY